MEIAATLPQGSFMAPLFLNTFTADMHEFDYIRRFVCSDDLALASQVEKFVEAEKKPIGNPGQTWEKYCADNGPNANSSKTVVCAYHLKTSQ